MQQRIGLAQALLHDPELLLLDEPTDGVDPVGRREIRDLLIHLRDEGRTILINSHILSELETICDQLAVVVKGRVALEGTIEELTSDRRRWIIAYKGTGPAWTNEETRQDGRNTQVILPGASIDDAQPVIDRIRSAGCSITDVSEVRESLEDLFMRALELADEEDAATPGATKGRVT